MGFSQFLLVFLLIASGEANAACIDHAKQCGAWAARGECTKNVEHMRKTCPKSCEACGETSEERPASAGQDSTKLASHAQGDVQLSTHLNLVPLTSSQSDSLMQQPLTSPAELQPQDQQHSLNLLEHRSNHLQEQLQQQVRMTAQLRPEEAWQSPTAQPLKAIDELPVAFSQVAEVTPAQRASSLPQGTLVAALREVTKCRAARVECQSELAKCNQAAAGSADKQQPLLQAERCVTQLQSTRASAVQFSRELNSTRDLLSAEQQSTRKLRRQLLQLQASANAAESNCRERLAAADTTCHALVEKLQQQIKNPSALETQLVTLRKKLQQKEAIEEAIEGKHSKLTQVYKTLESECQTELRACREAAANAQSASPPAASPSLPPPDVSDSQPPSECRSSSYMHYVHVVVALLLGMYIGNGFKPPRTLARKLLSGGASTRRTHVEELRSWIPPNVSCSFESGMKLS